MTKKAIGVNIQPMKLQEHIDEVTKNLIQEIDKIGLIEASAKINVTKSFICRFKSGKKQITAKKLIEYAHALGLDV